MNMFNQIYISIEQAETIIAFTKMHEREEIPVDMWELIMYLQEELEIFI